MWLITYRNIVVANFEYLLGTLAPPTTTTMGLSLGIIGITCLNGSPYIVRWMIKGLFCFEELEISLSIFMGAFS